jgi:general secretion pathway protein L
MQYNAALEHLQLRYQRSRAPAFLAWWSRQLSGFVPARWRRLLAQGEARVLFRAHEDGIDLVSAAGEAMALKLRVRPDQAAELEDALQRAEDKRPRWLLLDEAQVLRRRISLPLAAAPRLRELLAHEIDRQTPFRADQVAFDCRVVERDAEAGKLETELVVVPLSRLESTISRLGPLGTSLAGVDVEAAGRPLGLNLLPPGRRSQARDHMLWVHLALVAVIVAGAWFTLWQSLENRREAVAELRELVEQRQNEARRAAALREQLDAAAGGATFLAGLRKDRPRALEVIDDISRRLPDGTWLERLTINQGRVVLQGLSNEASGTIAWLQESPYLREPAFSGAVQPDARSGAQRFTLTADLTTPGEDR